MAERVRVAGTSRLVSWKVAGDGVCGERVRGGELLGGEAARVPRRYGGRVGEKYWPAQGP